jgi:hypothetical protein
MAQTVYAGPATVLYAGLPALEADSVRLSLATNNKNVFNRKGLAGHTKGPKVYTLAVSNALPSTGPEVEWMEIADAQRVVTIGVTFANKTYTLEGQVSEADYNDGGSQGEAVKLNFNFTGKLISRT